jgi:hypothetical protein
MAGASWKTAADIQDKSPSYCGPPVVTGRSVENRQYLHKKPTPHKFLSFKPKTHLDICWPLEISFNTASFALSATEFAVFFCRENNK